MNTKHEEQMRIAELLLSRLHVKSIKVKYGSVNSKYVNTTEFYSVGHMSYFFEGIGTQWVIESVTPILA